MTWHPDMPDAYRNQIVTGDARELTERLPAESVDLVVTSPPYFWARDYEVDNQIGHEQTVDEYIGELVSVFAQLKRALRPTGIIYLNIADTYYSGNGQPHGSDPRSPSRDFMRKELRPVDRSGWNIPKKSLIGIPWKMAFALQAIGLVLRSDIIWFRENAFAEMSARDRPHRKYEHVFLFSKSRWYFYDRAYLDGEEDVWTIPIEHFNDHNAAFPLALAMRCIMTGCPPGGIVIDPFIGSGTTGVAAIGSQKGFIGFELNPVTAARARERVANTQPPLFVLQPEQVEMQLG